MNNFIFKKYVQFIEQNGYFQMIFQPYNCSEITDISPTLTTNCGCKTSSAAVMIANLEDTEGRMNNLRIRKLTPKECWRLMGFDDEDFQKAEAVNSNTQLYKQAGNSIVVDVIEKIYKKLFKKYWNVIK